MKLLHLGDLHLGKSLGEYDLIEDQSYMLERILEITDREKIDAVLIAGDVYDKSIPSEAATRLLDSFLSNLAARKVKTFMISGNHDSDNRLNYGRALFKSSRIYISAVFDGHLDRHVIRDEENGIEVNIYMLPFVKASQVRHFFPDADIRTYEDAVRVILDHTDIEASPGSRDHADTEASPGSRDHADTEASPGSRDHADIEASPGSRDHADTEASPGSRDHADIEASPGSRDHADTEASPGSRDHADTEASPGSRDHTDTEVSPGSQDDTKICNILIAHQFVAGRGEDPALGGSEGAQTQFVGLVEKIGYDLFDAFDYVALGHIHSPQGVGRKEVRYSGSFLKYSLSEVHNEKSVPVITISKDSGVEIELVPLKPMRDVRHIRGKLKDLLDPSNVSDTEDYIYATLTDENIIDDAMGILRQTYPRTVKIDYDNSHTRSIEQADISRIAQNRSYSDLISDFYRVVYGQEISEEEMDIMRMAGREAGVIDEAG